MENIAREKLRKEVRAVVHRACWRRLEGDSTAADDQLSGDLASVLAIAEAAQPDEIELQRWRCEDEADFERGVLISELVARRMERMPRVAAAAGSNTVPSRDAEESTAPSVRAGPASIADMLDGMLAQERGSRSKKSGR